jgi:ferric-dicitrate binding protein FerR (iron transport regulator)
LNVLITEKSGLLQSTMSLSQNSHHAVQVRHEAGRRFALRQSRRLTSTERRELAAWLRAHRSHRNAWQRVKKDWQLLENLRPPLTAELQRARMPRANNRQSVLSGWIGRALISLTPILWQGIAGSEQEWHTQRGEFQEIQLADGTRYSCWILLPK